MRPVNKGQQPYTVIEKYQDAESYLEERLGRYCSFCEMRVNNQLAVEHKESKNSGGALTDWRNLLLSCSYCNSRKLEKIKKGESEKWLWPDQDNTFLAFTYRNGIPELNEAYLKSISEVAYERAKALFNGLVLDYRPGKGGGQAEKRKYVDKRWMTRFEALSVAEDAKCIWDKCWDRDSKDRQIKNIVLQAKGYGFFSVWMMIFEEDEEVRRALITAFPGTARDCFDDRGRAIPKATGII